MSVADHSEPIKGLCPDIEQLALYFAKIISSKHNQHAIIMIVGSAGKGKSWAAVSLAMQVAKKLSEILGGEPLDYFSFKETFATINKDDVKRVITNPKKHAVLLLDDVAAKAMNARNFNNKDNIDFNAILTTFRPNNNLVIMTTQAGFLIDKVPRSLSHYIIEMEQAYFDFGITTGKVKQVVFDHGIGKMRFPYIQIGGQKYVRHVFHAAPVEIMKEYESIRAQQLERTNEPEEREKPERTTLTARYKDKIFDMAEAGYTQKEMQQTIKREDNINISRGLISNILNY